MFPAKTLIGAPVHPLRLAPVTTFQDATRPAHLVADAICSPCSSIPRLFPLRRIGHAENVLPVIEQIRAGGASLRQIAAELNARGIKTARGGKWHATTVRNILTVENGVEVCAA